MLNRALFDRITIDDEENITATPKPAIATILASDTSPSNEKTLPRDDTGQGSKISDLVGVTVNALTGPR